MSLTFERSLNIFTGGQESWHCAWAAFCSCEWR